MNKPKKPQPEQSKPTLREQLNADIEVFLKAGGSIQEIPSGISGQDSNQTNKNIKLGSSKKTESLRQQNAAEPAATATK